MKKNEQFLKSEVEQLAARLAHNQKVAGNVWLPHLMEHDPGDALVLFENDDKAEDFARRRLMRTLRASAPLR